MSAPGPLTPLHYAANANFVNGVYAPAVDGFNLADVESSDQLAMLPAGDRALVFLDAITGDTSAFETEVNAFIAAAAANPSLIYGFYLADDPNWSQTTADELKAEAAYINKVMPTAITYMTEQNLSSPLTPLYDYTPANTGIDLFGLDPYPSQIYVPGNYDLAIIPAAVNEALSVGITLSQIVPLYQAFGGGGYSEYILPTAAQAQQILSTWAAYVPNPAFDYTYSWGPQLSDTALSTAPADLQQVFLDQNVGATPAILSAGGLVNQPTQTIAGMLGSAGAGLTVTLLDGTTQIGSAVADSTGAWSTSVALPQDGANAITAQATYAVGVVTSLPVTFTLVRTVADFLANQAAIDQQTGLFALADTAANVAAGIDTLNADAHVASLTLTDSGTPVLTVTATQAATDTTVFSEIANPLFEVIGGSTPQFHVGGNGAYGTSIAVQATNDTVTLRANSRMDLFGSGDTVISGANTNFAVHSGASTITAGASDGIWLASGSGDVVTAGANDAINFSYDASGSVTAAANDVISVAAGSSATIAAAANDVVNVAAGASATVTGVGAKIVAASNGASVTLGGNGAYGTPIVVQATNDTVTLQANSRMDLTGSGDTVISGANTNFAVHSGASTITAGASDGIWLASGSGDVVTAGANDAINFSYNASGSVTAAANDVISVAAGSSATIAAAANDVVNVAAGANATVTGVGATIFAAANGAALIVGGNGAYGTPTEAYATNDSVTLQANSRMDLFGSGDSVASGANTNFAVHGSDFIVVAGASDGVWLAGGSGDVVTAGANDAINFSYNASGSVTAGANDVVNIGGGSTATIAAAVNDVVNLAAGAAANMTIGTNIGALTISGFAGDPTGVIDLLNGVGGYATAAAAVGAVASDGQGGSLLSLGASGSIDFVGVATGTLTAANFKVG